MYNRDMLSKKCGENAEEISPPPFPLILVFYSKSRSQIRPVDKIRKKSLILKTGKRLH